MNCKYITARKKISDTLFLLTSGLLIWILFLSILSRALDIF
ncbi:hypothetical protein RVIR1_05630 [Candidatus Rickettsiella viridis]|uniref:Uncharacterized protein n=1 Tax=Candidatus Rickettsiella viridis TaxID=676208 RepID=A0A2Z5UVH8_9COXI|nr:hypothetical protein RVIR1_05630 [Candidatus Rickettsiella viridis]